MRPARKRLISRFQCLIFIQPSGFAVRLCKKPVSVIAKGGELFKIFGMGETKPCFDGMFGFDVSNGISPDERYVRVATGPDYTEASAVSGLRLGAGAERMIITLREEH
jgi:hypothetical protein